MLGARLLLVPLLALATSASGAAQDGAALSPGAHTETINGLRQWYRVAGARQGVPVVFVHGGPGEGSQTFATLAGPALERSGLRMVYWDQRGSGRSERPEAGPYSQDLLVADLEALRNRFGVNRIALIGHSYGTVIALEYAALHPQHVSRMVLTGTVADVPAMLDQQCQRLSRVDPAAFARASNNVAAGTRPRCDPFAAYQGIAMQAAISRNMFPNKATEEIVTRTDEADGLKNTGQLSKAVFKGGFLHYRFRRPERLTMPILFIAGGKDYQAVIEPTRVLAAKLPRATVLEYPASGHFMFVEEPQRFARDVSRFLRSR